MPRSSIAITGLTLFLCAIAPADVTRAAESAVRRAIEKERPDQGDQGIRTEETLTIFTM
jgi:hypothetical protein